MGTPYQPQQPQQPYVPPPQGQVPYGPGEAPLSPVAIAGLLMGLISIPSCMCCSCFALIPYVVAVVCGGVAWMQYSNGQANALSRNLGIAGVVIPTVVYVVLTIVYLGLYGVAGVMEMMNPENISQIQDVYSTY